VLCVNGEKSVPEGSLSLRPGVLPKAHKMVSIKVSVAFHNVVPFGRISQPNHHRNNSRKSLSRMSICGALFGKAHSPTLPVFVNQLETCFSENLFRKKTTSF